MLCMLIFFYTKSSSLPIIKALLQLHCSIPVHYLAFWYLMRRKKGMSEKCIKTLILLMANHKLIFHALGFYGLTMEIFSSYFSEITENSKKWKPLLAKEEKLSIIKVNSSYLRSMNDYRVTFLYRTFKFH